MIDSNGTVLHNIDDTDMFFANSKIHNLVSDVGD